MAAYLAAMCNLYSQPLLGVFPDYSAPIGRNAIVASWWA
jgi:hypothetical protein